MQIEARSLTRTGGTRRFLGGLAELVLLLLGGCGDWDGDGDDRCLSSRRRLLAIAILSSPKSEGARTNGASMSSAQRQKNTSLAQERARPGVSEVDTCA